MIDTAWEWLNQYSGALTVLLAAIAVVPGVIAIRSAKQDSRDRSRPVIVAELQLHPDAETNLLLIVRNVGVSVARMVSITFDPPLADRTPDSHYPAYMKRMFSEPISTFAPGQSMRNPWYSKEDKGAPEVCTVTARYTDSHGRPYVDSYVLSVAPYLASLFIESSASIKGRMKTLAEEAKKQTVAVQSIAKSMKRASDQPELTIQEVHRRLSGGDNG